MTHRTSDINVSFLSLVQMSAQITVGVVITGTVNSVIVWLVSVDVDREKYKGVAQFRTVGLALGLDSSPIRHVHNVLQYNNKLAVVISRESTNGVVNCVQFPDRPSSIRTARLTYKMLGGE